MVDMSSTLMHHGHIRLLKKAFKHGNVIVGLTTDEEIKIKKGYTPEIDFKHRKEILESIKYVSEVVAVPWLLTNETLKEHNIDLLVHGDDNSNDIEKNKLLIFPRTKNVCSSVIRNKSAQISGKIQRNILLNPGPATTTDSVKMAQVVPDICPREIEFGNLMQSVSLELTKIVADPKKYTTILFGGSGTAVVESTISSVVPHDKKILIVNNGAYGKRMCQIADAYDMNYIEFKSSPIETIDYKLVQTITMDQKKRILRIEKYASSIISYLPQSHLQERSFLDLLLIGLPVNIPHSYQSGKKLSRRNTDTIKILHSPSDMNIKGTAEIHKIIAKIRIAPYRTTPAICFNLFSSFFLRCNCARITLSRSALPSLLSISTSLMIIPKNSCRNY